jgi:hypothetical protein
MIPHGNTKFVEKIATIAENSLILSAAAQFD